MNSIYTMNSKYYNFSKCYKSYDKSCNTNDITKIEKYINENSHTDNNTCLNFICVSLAKNKLLELNMNKQQEILNKYNDDIDMLKREIVELKKHINNV